MSESTETETVVGPGRKPGAMKRDDKGRLLKKDGTLSKTPGRKKGTGNTVTKTEVTKTEVKKKPGKRGRPAGKKNTTAKKPGKRGRPKGSKVTTQTTTVSMSKDLKAAIKTFDKASKALVKALSK